MAASRGLGVAGAVVALSSCVYTPQVVKRYDERCDIEFRQMVLTTQQLGLLDTTGLHCGGKDCLAILAAQVMLIPASAIVSGSIVLVGNTLFWMQKEGQCLVQTSHNEAAQPPLKPSHEHG